MAMTMVERTTKFVEAEETTMRNLLKIAIDNISFKGINDDESKVMFDCIGLLGEANEYMIALASAIDRMTEDLDENRRQLNEILKVVSKK